MTPEQIKAEADRIVEKHKRFHYGRRDRTVNLLSVGHAIIEVDACIELMHSFGYDLFPITIDRYNLILTELKSRV